VVHFQPFDPVHKRTEATVKGADGKEFKVSKGAPQVILELSADAGQVKGAVEKAIDEFAVRGFRSLGVARATGKAAGSFWACCRFSTRPGKRPKRPSQRPPDGGEASRWSPAIKVAIARETAASWGWALTSSTPAASATPSTTRPRSWQVPSRKRTVSPVFPEHKFHIVDVLQKRGQSSADRRWGERRPRAEEADWACGLGANGRGARGGIHRALDVRPVVIIDAIKESRKIFQRMNSYAYTASPKPCVCCSS